MMSADDISKACLSALEILDASDFLRNSNDQQTGENFSASEKNLACSVFISSKDKTYDEDQNCNVRLTDFQVDILSDIDSNKSELQNTLEDIATVSEMNEFILREIEKFKKRNISVLEDISPNVKYISDFCVTADKLKNITNHMKTLSCEGNKLKQVLTSAILKDVWKINKNYHRSVINFFKMLSELIKEFEVLITSVESRKLLNPELSKVMAALNFKILLTCSEHFSIFKDGNEKNGKNKRKETASAF